MKSTAAGIMASFRLEVSYRSGASVYGVSKRKIRNGVLKEQT